MMFSAPIQLITYFIAAAVCVGNTSTTQLVDVVECNPSFHVEQSVCRFMCREPGSTVDEIKLERNIVCTSLELVNIKEVNNVVLVYNENIESVTAPGLEYISVLRLYFDRRLQKIPILDFIDIERLPQSISIDGSYVIVCINSLPYELNPGPAGILSLDNWRSWEGNPCSTRKATESPSSAPTVSPTDVPMVSHTSTPTSSPTTTPTGSPTTRPARSPSISPTATLTGAPTSSPTSTEEHIAALIANNKELRKQMKRITKKKEKMVLDRLGKIELNKKRINELKN